MIISLMNVLFVSLDITVEQRLGVLDRFRAGMYKVLVATDVLSRGIDVEQVTLVVNYDLPIDRNGNPNYETYLHRIGRTGRFGKNGIAINMVTTEEDLQLVKQIEKYFEKKIFCLDTDDIDEIEKIGTWMSTTLVSRIFSNQFITSDFSLLLLANFSPLFD